MLSEEIVAAIAAGDCAAVVAALMVTGKTSRLMGEALSCAARTDQLEVAKAILKAWPEAGRTDFYCAARGAIDGAGEEMVGWLVGRWHALSPTDFKPWPAARNYADATDEEEARRWKIIDADLKGRVIATEVFDSALLAAAQRGERERVAWLKAHASAEGRKAAEVVLDGSSPAIDLPLPLPLPRRRKP